MFTIFGLGALASIGGESLGRRDETTTVGAGWIESYITFFSWEKFSSGSISDFQDFEIANFNNECQKGNFKVFDRNDICNVNQLCYVITLFVVILAFIIAEFFGKGPQRT